VPFPTESSSHQLERTCFPSRPASSASFVPIPSRQPQQRNQRVMFARWDYGSEHEKQSVTQQTLRSGLYFGPIR
jgi:hypothetical protein